MCLYIYIYIYIYRERERERERMTVCPALSIRISLFQLLLFQEKKRKILKIDQTLCTVALSSLHACKYKIVKNIQVFVTFFLDFQPFFGSFQDFLDIA